MEKTITKEKIAEMLNDSMGISKAVCEEIVNATFEEIFALAKSSHKLTLQNFGTFKIHKKDSRPGLNINTGERVNIKAREVLTFSPSKALKNKINK